MYNLIKSFVNLFLLRVKPEDIIYSKALLVFLVGMDFVVNYEANVIGIKVFNLVNKQQINFLVPSLAQSLVILAVLFLVLWTLVYTTLAIYNKTNRFIQILTSLVAVDIAIRLLIIICIIILRYSAFLATILLIPVVCWEFILYIFIFSNGFNFNYLKAGAFSLVYMLVQHNLGEILVNYICN
jgi:hypothetical protein